MLKKQLMRGPATITITVDGERTVLALNNFGARLSDFRRFWKEFYGPQWFEDIQKNFASAGRLVGGWAPLSPRYAAWKLKHFGPKPILVRKDAMRRSLEIGGPGNVFKATKARGIFGSNDPKVPYHQRGTRRMPARPVIFIGASQTYQRLLNRFVREEQIAAGLRLRRA